MNKRAEDTLRTFLNMNLQLAQHCRDNPYREAGPYVERVRVNELLQLHATNLDSNTRVINRLLGVVHTLEHKVEVLEHEVEALQQGKEGEEE